MRTTTTHEELAAQPTRLKHHLALVVLFVLIAVVLARLAPWIAANAASLASR